MKMLIIPVIALACILVFLLAANVTSNAAAETVGFFNLSYVKPTDISLAPIYEAIKKNNFFGGAVDGINEQISLPFEIDVDFIQCGEAHAFYDSRAKKVSICYEFINGMANLYAAANIPGSPGAAAIDNAEFVLFHEIGHSLIDSLNLPVTGREEDAADQFAVLAVLQRGDAPAAVTAAALGIQGANRDPNTLNFADEHSLDSQRFYNILCWLYGQNPAKYQDAVDKMLPAERAQRCEGEFARMADSWSRLLKPFEKA